MLDDETRKKAIELVKTALDTIHEQLGECTQGCSLIEAQTPEFNIAHNNFGN